MQIVKFGEKFNSSIVVALGFFGCMHKGHLQLLHKAKQIARKTDAKVALFTFQNNHLQLLGSNLKQLYTFDERCKIYQNLGVDVLLTAQFDQQFKNTYASDFLKTLSTYNLQGVVGGFDYTCGCDRQNCQYVHDFFANVSVEIVDAVCQNGEKISTTYVRNLLDHCKIQQTNELLSQNFFFDGKVVHGRNVGTQIGFPTANVQVDVDKYLPTGVFAGTVVLSEKIHRCIVNIGAKPTYNIDEPTVEVHVIDFCGDLYGQNLTVNLTKFLRPICKFDSPQQLIQQLKIDKENCLDD